MQISHFVKVIMSLTDSQLHKMSRSEVMNTSELNNGILGFLT